MHIGREALTDVPVCKEREREREKEKRDVKKLTGLSPSSFWFARATTCRNDII